MKVNEKKQIYEKKLMTCSLLTAQVKFLCLFEGRFFHLFKEKRAFDNWIITCTIGKSGTPMKGKEKFYQTQEVEVFFAPRFCAILVHL